MTTTIRNHRISAAAALTALALLVASCGGDDATTETTPTTAIGSTSTAAPATSTTDATTTTAVTTTISDSTTTTATPTTAATTTTTDVNTLAEGSGCTPASDELDDGIWFGYVDSATETELGFDLACWFSGDAAARAAAEDGEESPPPNDYYVRNQSEQLRILTVHTDAEVSWLPNPGDPSTQTTVSYGEWLTGRSARDEELFAPGVWVTITDGEASFIEEQYVP